MHIDDIKYLCFGVGGMNGWVHVGILGALERELIRRGTTMATQIRGASGASIGSLLAVAVALSLSAEEIKSFLLECTERYRNRIGTMKVMNLITKKGLLPTTALASAVQDLVARKFGQEMRQMTMAELYKLTNKACYITTHNITRTRGEVISHSTFPDLPVFKAVCMSCAIPGIFEPVEHNGSLYIDSAMSNELPFEVFNDMESTLAFYLVGDLKPIEPNAMTVQDLFYRITCAFSLITEAKINALPQHLKSHVLWLRVPCLIGKALQGFMLDNAERERLVNIGQAAGQALVHYKMAVLSQAATLYISSRRGLGATAHAAPKVPDIVICGDPAAPDGPHVAGKDFFDPVAGPQTVLDPEPPGEGVLEQVHVDAVEQLPPQRKSVRRGEDPQPLNDAAAVEPEGRSGHQAAALEAD